MALHLLIAMTCAMLLATVANSAANMGSFSITATGQLTMIQQWALTADLAGFRLMAQDLGLGAPPNSFYSIAGSVIPPGGNTSAFTHYIAASGFPTRHSDLGNKLTPDSYSALTSADPDIGFGEVNFYLIHHKGSTDYFTTIVPSTGTASAVTDLKPMSGPGGPGTVTGVSGYAALAFAAANLGYGLNMFYYIHRNSTTNATFGSLAPGLAGTATQLFDLGPTMNITALEFVGGDVGYGVNRMYYLRSDAATGFSIFGTLNPATGAVADIANLGGVFNTATFASADVGYGANHFYVAGVFSPTWQSVSFAAIGSHAAGGASFTVTPTASSGLGLTLTVDSTSVGSVTIAGPVAGVFTVTPVSPGMVTLTAAQAGTTTPAAFRSNMLQQSFTITATAPPTTAPPPAPTTAAPTASASPATATVVPSAVPLAPVAPSSSSSVWSLTVVSLVTAMVTFGVAIL